MPRKVKDSGRKVLYREITVEVCRGKGAITVARAKDLLGWREPPEGTKVGIVKVGSHKICLDNNVTNRPIYSVILRTLTQEILRKRWRINCEPIIIGRTGLVLNGQHALLSLILATDEWRENKDKWDTWKTEPRIEKLIAFGCSEDDNTVNTMDTCKPRSLTDVIYRSEFFAAMQPKNRKQVARILDYAVRLLWYRIGMVEAFAPRRTHAESLALIETHPKLLECVQHVYEEDCDRSYLSRITSAGSMAGLLYLMGCSATNPTKYNATYDATEKLLTWKMWNRACDFITLLGNDNEDVAAVHKTLRTMQSKRESRITQAERWAIVVKAWNLFREGKPILAKDLKLAYTQNSDGEPVLAEIPTVGGIDLGSPDNVDIPVGNDPTPEEIAEIREEREKKEEEKKPKKKKNGKIRVGKIVWVNDPSGKHWRGKIVELTGNMARLKVSQGHEGAGNIKPAVLPQLQYGQPEPPE